MCVAEGCSADVKSRVPGSANILPPRETRLGSSLLWDIRALKEAAIPEGVETIGKEWFVGSGIVQLTISASVTSIEEGAFFKCRTLTQVSFAEGSRLHKLG